MRLIARDLIITPISSVEYISQFGMSFEQAEFSNEAPVPYISLSELLDDLLDLFTHEDILDLIDLQVNAFYQDAIRIRAIALGKFNMDVEFKTSDAENKIRKAFLNGSPLQEVQEEWRNDWRIDNASASALYMNEFQIRFFRVIDNVIDIGNEDVVHGFFKTQNGDRWSVVTTHSSFNDLDEKIGHAAIDKTMYQIGVEAAKLWNDEIHKGSTLIPNFGYTNNLGFVYQYDESDE